MLQIVARILQRLPHFLTFWGEQSNSQETMANTGYGTISYH